MGRTTDRVACSLLVLSALVLVACGKASPTSNNSPNESSQLGEAQEAITGQCRTLTLEASRSTAPPHFTDGTATESPSFSFQIPEILPVTEGATGHGTATLSFRLGTGPTVTCTYHGDGDDSDGHGGGICDGHDNDHGKHDHCTGHAYLLGLFGGCTNGAHAGEVETADHFTLHIDSSCEQAPITKVSLTLDEHHPCQGGGSLCTGVVCSALDQCHVAGTCDPSTGQCSNPTKADGTSCSDGSLCTSNDVCSAGVCAGIPVTCSALDQCHVVGACNPSTGQCSNPTQADGTACSDGSLCTSNDVCSAGVCAGIPVTCSALDQCHVVGACNPSTGQCSNPTKADGTACSDGSLCTSNDVCSAGVCAGTPVTCSALDQCHVVGACDPSSGACTTPNKPDGSSCNDGSLCTTNDACNAGVCAGTPRSCTPCDACHLAGKCNASTGQCSNPPATSGTQCGGNVCTGLSTCNGAGMCNAGTPPTLVNTACETQTCDPTNGIVTTFKPSGTTCGGDVCAGVATCDGSGTCVPGTPPNLASSDPCIVNVCNVSTGVTSEPAPAGTSCATSNPCSTGDTCDGADHCVGALPVGLDDNDPSTIDYCTPSTGIVHYQAPPLDQSVTTTVSQSLAFLYTGPNPIQTGVAPGTIEVVRAAGIQGHVTFDNGMPAMLASVSVLNHPELGETIVDGEGNFDIAVNGGGQLTDAINAPGYLPAQRTVEAPWNDYARTSDVELVSYDPNATVIDLPDQVQYEAARGSVETDTTGTRQTTLLVPPGTTATMTMADGSTEPLSTLTIHATEFTVGPTGPARMPADLPDTSDYTYAVDVSAEEAVAAGALHVTFDQPLSLYFENYYNFAVGTVVPVGSYDAQHAVWNGEANGLVVQILSTSGGVATIDTNGSGTPASASTLSALGITAGEQEELAALYAPGTMLWRIPVHHFSALDGNMAWAAAGASPPPGGPGPSPASTPDPGCTTSAVGSTIECDNGIVGETIDVVGTGMTLNHWSDRSPGFAANRTITTTLTEATIPTGLQKATATLEIAGKTYSTELTCPCAPNQTATFTWDGLDAFGRPSQGQQQAKVSWRYFYVAEPRGVIGASAYTSFFAQYGGLPLTYAAGGPTTSGRLIGIPKTYYEWLGTFDQQGFSVGGWSLSTVHAYDVAHGRLLRGDGTRLTEDALPITTTSALFTSTSAGPNAVAAMPDGSLIVNAAATNGAIERWFPDGTEKSLTNGPGCSSADGAIAPKICASDVADVQVGPDGSIYYAEDEHVRRIGPDGAVHTFAGQFTNDNEYAGDGGLATSALSPRVTALAVGPDGAVYVGAVTRIRRVGPEGIIETILGNGTAASNVGNGGPSWQAEAASIDAMTVGADGTVYFADRDGSDRVYVRSISVDGVVHWVGGGAACTASSQSGNGIAALSACFFNATGLAVERDGTVLLATTSVDGWNSLTPTNAIRAIATDGTVRTLAGRANSTCADTVFCNSGAPATTTFFPVLRRLALGPNDHVFAADQHLGRVLDLHPALPGLTASDIVIPDDGGRVVHIFNDAGKHLETVDSVTGTVLEQMSYDADGLLSTVTDKDGLVTTIQRATNGAPVAVIAPFGQATTLTLNTNGLLARATDPNGGHWDVSYQDGEIAEYTNRDGHTSTLTYDANGRLLKDEDPAGGFQALTRVDSATGFQSTRSTALGRTYAYGYDTPSSAVNSTTKTTPDGLTSTLTRDPTNTFTWTAPDGTVTSRIEATDPRFGLLASDLGTTTETTPGGLKRTTTLARSVVLSNPANLLSVQTTTDTTSVNGETWTNTYATATNTLTSTTPAGRTTTSHYDGLGHLLEVDVPELLPLTFQYDAFGRLQSTTQGPRVSSLTYGSDGFVATSTDALNETSSFIRDLNGRVLSATRPDQAVTGFSYNSEGNTTEVVPPGDPAHDFTFDNREMVSVYSPPTLAGGPTPTGYQYNLDKQSTEVDQPGPRIISYGYDSAGRLTTTTFPTGAITRTYEALGRLGSLAGPTGVTLSFGYDGALEKSVTWSGAVSGSLTRTFDTNFRLASESVNGGTAVSFGYDADSLLTSAGTLSIARDPNNGRVTGTTAGNVTDTYTYNQLGEVAGYTASYSGNGLLSFMYNRDDLGRITDKLETDGNGSHAFHYDYDLAGRLTQVTEDGTVVEAYQYDENGNRTLSMNSAGTFEATFDAQDRMLTYGTLVFTYTENGELASKTDASTGDVTAYSYDALGNLRGVTLPDGTQIGYLVDGFGRRVGKTVNGVLVKQWLWRGRLQPVAELDGAGNVTARFVYGAASGSFASAPPIADSMPTDGTGPLETTNVPHLIVTATSTYRLVKDHLGSVRQVTDVSTGVVVQEIVYDSWGRILSDSNPGFQPFGFAGGLYDADTGLVRFGARDYDAEMGSWTSADPLEFPVGGLNRDEYAGSDPVNLLDSTGYSVAPSQSSSEGEGFDGGGFDGAAPQTCKEDPRLQYCLDATYQGMDGKEAFCRYEISEKNVTLRRLCWAATAQSDKFWNNFCENNFGEPRDRR